LIRAYIRTSGDEDTKKAPETQRGLIRNWAEDRPVVWYEDIGYSGGDWNRPRFSDMERDCKKGDVVVVAAQDRWARDKERYYVKLHEFKERGVTVVMLGESEEPIVSGVAVLMAEQYRLDIKKKIANARRFRGGKWGAARHTEAEIRGFLEMAKSVGPTKAALAAGVSLPTFFRWRKRLGWTAPTLP